MNIMKGIIYKIYSNKGNDIYIGITTKKIQKRFTKHIDDYINLYKKDKKKCSSSYKIFDKYGVLNCFIEVIEEGEYKSKEDLLKKETEYILTLENCINNRLSWKQKKITKTKDEHIEYNEDLNEYFIYENEDNLNFGFLFGLDEE